MHAKQKIYITISIARQGNISPSKTTSTDTYTRTRQHQPEQVSETFAHVVKKCSCHEKRRLSVATRQIALSSGGGTTNATPNLLPACKPPAQIITLTSCVARHEVCRLWQPEGGVGTTVKISPTNITPLGMLAPKSHASVAKMHLRRMKEGAMWRTGYVDAVNGRLHMPTTKIRSPTSGL